MDVNTNYPIGTILPSSITVPAALSGTETDVFKITDQTSMRFSQLSIYLSVTLEAVTSATFNYYYSPDNGTTWFPVSLFNASTGEMTQRSVVIDSGTYATGGVSLTVDNHALGAVTGFKVTGKSASGTPAFTISIVGRNN